MTRGFLHSLQSRHVRLALIAFSLMSLIVYIFPSDPNPLIMTGTRWVYYYRETILSRGNLTHVYEAKWRYQVLNSSEEIAYVRMNGTSRLGYRSENGSWVEINRTESSSFLLDARTRLYGYSFYSSWWVPANLRLGDIVPAWNLNLRVVSLTWRVVGGWFLECWVLEDRFPGETYTFYYERTTGFFVHFDIERTVGNVVISIERSLINMSPTWPALTFIRPFLIPAAMISIVFLLLPFIDELRRSKKKLPESPII